MSRAQVQFLTLQGEPCPAGEKPARFTFRCVNYNKRRSATIQKAMEEAGVEPIMCGELLLHPGPHTQQHGIKHDGQGLNGGTPQWTWDGNRESPTFTPSINCEKHCGWHGYLRSGQCVNTNGQPEPES